MNETRPANLKTGPPPLCDAIWLRILAYDANDVRIPLAPVLNEFGMSIGKKVVLAAYPAPVNGTFDVYPTDVQLVANGGIDVMAFDARMAPLCHERAWDCDVFSAAAYDRRVRMNAGAALPN